MDNALEHIEKHETHIENHEPCWTTIEKALNNIGRTLKSFVKQKQNNETAVKSIEKH